MSPLILRMKLDYAETEIGAHESEPIARTNRLRRLFVGCDGLGVADRAREPRKDGVTGEGLWLCGARWNSPGVCVVYVSAHRSAAPRSLSRREFFYCK